MTPVWRVEPLDPRHDRTQFDCGVAPLDRYIREQATQDVRRLVATCFVACEASNDLVAGYYTLAAAELALDAVPSALAKKLPRYPSVPVVRIGRLAVDKTHRGKGLGAMLVANAMGRVARTDIGAWAVVVDAKNDAAAAFYRHLGFVAAGAGERAMMLPMVRMNITGG